MGAVIQPEAFSELVIRFLITLKKRKKIITNITEKDK
jgi:hypothetical protein